MSDRNWRAPENRREAFQREYSFSLKYRVESGMPYLLLPPMVEHFDAEPAWVAWLDASCQIPVTTQLLLEVAPRSEYWREAVNFWEKNYSSLEWDTDRRQQKRLFGDATEAYIRSTPPFGSFEADWERNSSSWESAWAYALSLPSMGRYSAWVLAETANLMLPGVIPEPTSQMFNDRTGSKSHRHGAAIIAGFGDAHTWGPGDCDLLGLVPSLEALAADLLAEARERNPGNPDANMFTLESELCAYKKFWRGPLPVRFPNWYADKHHRWITKAEAKWGERFDLQWDIRADHLPRHLRLEVTTGEIQHQDPTWWNKDEEKPL